MEFVEVGKIINTHGLRGDVKVTAWTDTPEDFEDIPKVYIKRKTGENFFSPV
jgi:16S rRNA processing protein RimM